nr:MAG TPA: hypothetical protein [Caudoviricetes sp.]
MEYSMKFIKLPPSNGIVHMIKYFGFEHHSI